MGAGRRGSIPSRSLSRQYADVGRELSSHGIFFDRLRSSQKPVYAFGLGIGWSRGMETDAHAYCRLSGRTTTPS